MTLSEQTAYLKGLAEGLGVDPQSKEGRLFGAVQELLMRMAREFDELHEADRRNEKALDELADELRFLEELNLGEDEDFDEDDDSSEDEPYDGVVYDATCPVCGEEISFDEETLEAGSISCPKCGELLEFDLSEGPAEAPAEEKQD